MKRKSPLTAGTATASVFLLGLGLLAAPCSLSNAAQPPAGAADTEQTEATQDGAGKRSPFGGLGRLFKRSKPAAEPDAAPAATDAAREDQPTGLGEEERPRRGLRALLGSWDSGRAETGNATEPPDAPADSAAPTDANVDPSRADKFVITEAKVQFFEDSPLQTRGADELLRKGTIVTVVKMRRGWTDVVLESGKFGTVSTDVLRKAMASDFPVPEFVVKDLGRSENVAAYYEQMANLPPVPPPALPDDTQAFDEGDLLGNPLLLLPPLDPASAADDGSSDASDAQDADNDAGGDAESSATDDGAEEGE